MDDNETWLAKIEEVDHCMRQTKEVTPDKDCFPKTSWAKTSPSDKKKWALCKAQQFEDRGNLYCDQINKRSAQIQSFLYKQTANVVNDPQRFNSLTQEAQETENNSIKEYNQWLTRAVNNYFNYKKTDELIKYGEKLISDIDEGERRREMTRAIVDGLKSKKPQNSVIQMQGGPPIYCKTVKDYTSCGYMPSN